MRRPHLRDRMRHQSQRLHEPRLARAGPASDAGESVPFRNALARVARVRGGSPGRRGERLELGGRHDGTPALQSGGTALSRPDTIPERSRRGRLKTVRRARINHVPLGIVYR
jgi:hypothetical protein